MKKLWTIALITLLPILLAAGSVYLIYNEVNTETLNYGHTGQDTLRYVVNGQEEETLTEDDIQWLYEDMYMSNYDDIVFHTFPSDTLFSQPRTYYLPVHVPLKAYAKGDLVLTYDVPSDMTVQAYHTKAESGDTIHTFEGADTEQVDLFFYFEGDEVEFRDGEFTIEFTMRLE